MKIINERKNQERKYKHVEKLQENESCVCLTEVIS